MKKILNNLILELHVPDFKSIQEFYSLLGFELVLEDTATDKERGYMVLKRKDALGETILNFYGNTNEVSKHKHFVQFPEGTPRGYAVEITIPVEDIEEFWNKTKAVLTKESISQELEMKSFGKKDFRLTDPAGFYLRFTELV